jgi:ADP-ribose pyrophosphatase YjhB (NUDIX family)
MQLAPDEEDHLTRGAAMDDPGTALRCSTLVWRSEPAAVLLVRRERDGHVEFALPGGTPRAGESLSSCARREVLEEAGLHVDPTRIAFLLEVVDGQHDRVVDVVFTADLDRSQREESPLKGSEPHLRPQFVEVDRLSAVNLLPPIAGHIRGFARDRRPPTIPVLGNLWRSDAHASARLGRHQ